MLSTWTGLSESMKNEVYQREMTKLMSVSRQELDEHKAYHVDRSDFLDDAWDDFQANYPELSEDPEGVAQAAATVYQRMKDQGVKNVDRQVAKDPEAFLGEVALEMASQPFQRRDVPVNRTMVFGGDGGRGTTGTGVSSRGWGEPEAEPDGPSSGDMITEWQRRNKYV
jgi:hypothetical protein